MLRVRGGNGCVIVAEGGGAWLGTIMCGKASCED